MPWVITRLCSDCKDVACVEVCPVDCIYGLTTEDENYRNQLFIQPDECIDCAACEPECPWGAIFEDSSVPDKFAEDTQINAKVFEEHPKEEFTITPEPVRKNPSPDDVEENNQKWGYQP